MPVVAVHDAVYLKIPTDVKDNTRRRTRKRKRYIVSTTMFRVLNPVAHNYLQVFAEQRSIMDSKEQFYRHFQAEVLGRSPSRLSVPCDGP